MKKLYRILCALGIHFCYTIDDTRSDTYILKKCKHCGKFVWKRK